MGEIARYYHDCTSCKFLGQYQPHSADEEGDKYDLYYCSRSDGGSVIARFGNEPSEYASMALCILIYAGLAWNNPLIEATRRQIAKWVGRDLD